MSFELMANSFLQFNRLAFFFPGLKCKDLFHITIGIT